MRIMVFDVPAGNGGALTILNQYYEKAVNDKENDWIFVISTPNLSETKNVKVLKYPWIKKSWFHRLYFDKIVAHKIVEKYRIEIIQSLQNVIIQGVKVKQILYIHQPLPFIEKRYSITENFKFWLYQNVISNMIFNSIKYADKVIVQTKWMKEACLKKVKTDSNKIEVVQPLVSIKVKKSYKQEDKNIKLFFYPASGLIYKNHKIIVECAIKLKERNITNYRVVFTLSGNDGKEIKKLLKIVKEYNLPIDFIGQINLEEVYEYYSKSILIFPSYIETFGLPLLEAKLHDCPVIASDCAFSHEILDDYKKAQFFNPLDAEKLSQLMEFQLKA